MNPHRQPSAMHFKSAQIAGVELSPNDLAQINQYSLSPLSSDEIFAFKVSMAANEIDRDFEVFPRQTLAKLANLFVGKTVVKDHDHKSDNQLARIFGTELVESDHMRLTRGGEVMTELIAKCYMVRTSKNADLIAEIQAGIRKEVSLGCRIGKAVCSVCGTDNVKTYCTHFAGKQYDGKVCYFSLQDPQDAYELSFVAIPAQQHAGTVKSYGEKPCYQKDMNARKQAADIREEAAEPESTRDADQPAADQTTTEHSGKTPERKEREATSKADDERYERLSTELSDLSSKVSELVAILAKNAADDADNAAKSPESAQNVPKSAPDAPENAPETTDSAAEKPQGSTAEEGPELKSDAATDAETDVPPDESRLTVNPDGAEPESSAHTAPDRADAQAVPSAEADEAVKGARAQARLRALEMAIALQKNDN